MAEQATGTSDLQVTNRKFVRTCIEVQKEGGTTKDAAERMDMTIGNFNNKLNSLRNHPTEPVVIPPFASGARGARIDRDGLLQELADAMGVSLEEVKKQQAARVKEIAAREAEKEKAKTSK